MSVTEQTYETRELAAAAAAQRIMKALRCDLEIQPAVSLVVSGGSSPVRCFNLLAETHLDWARVQVLMSDERYVASNHHDSNEGMIRRELLTGSAAPAKIVPMYQQGVGVAERCEQLQQVMVNQPRPHSITLLGMGEDGHFASLFPDFDRLEDGLRADTEAYCMPVKTVASPHSRITLTLPALLNSSEILLLFFGPAKREVYEQSKRKGSTYPLASLLQQNRTRVHVIWAA